MRSRYPQFVSSMPQFPLILRVLCVSGVSALAFSPLPTFLRLVLVPPQISPEKPLHKTAKPFRMNNFLVIVLHNYNRINALQKQPLTGGGTRKSVFSTTNL